MNVNYKKLTLTELCDRLLALKRPVILMHTRPDGDAVGSAFALSLIFKAAGREARCLCADPVPQRLSFLTENADPCLTKETLAGYDYDGAVCIDIGAAGQLGALAEYFGGRIDLMIDHHSKGEPFADHYINIDAAAAGEIVYEIATELCRRGVIDEINTKTAACIYAAISSDTGCFKFSNVTPRTHRIAAELLERNIPFTEINRRLFESKSVKLLSAERIALEKLKFYDNGRVSVCAVSNTDKAAAQLQDEHFETTVDIARSAEGVMIGIAIKEIEKYPGCFRVSMRANGDTNVAEICAHFGGGGHMRAAGCTVECGDIDEAVGMVLDRMGIEH